MIEGQAKCTPGAIAIEVGSTLVTYAELIHRSRELAEMLVRAGVNPERAVCVDMCRGYELVIALLAVSMAGGVYVPLDPMYPQRRLAAMIEDAAPAAFIAGPGSKLADAARHDEVPVLAVSASKTSAGRQIADDQGRRRANAVPVPANALYAMFTSGSTGRPKAVVNTHEGFIDFLLWMREAFPLDASRSVLMKTQIGFDVSMWEICWPLICGARLVVPRPENHLEPSYLTSFIQRCRVTDIILVPLQLSAFLADTGARDCVSLRRVFSIGEALPSRTAALFRQVLGRVELHNTYGPTEAAVAVTAWLSTVAESMATAVPIGTAQGRSRLHIVDANLCEVPAGVPGELCITGPQVARGYPLHPGMTADRFVPNPFADAGLPGCSRLYRTGDLARLGPGGAVEFLGRNDRQVKVRGQRVELGDIEAALSALPGVREAEAALRPDRSGQDRLVAWAVAQRTGLVSGGQLRDALRVKVPSSMIPDVVVVLEQFPLLANGKLDRSALPDPFASRVDVAAEMSTSACGLEQIVSQVWGRVLGHAPAGRHTSFFDEGGNSLLLLDVLARLRAAGLRVELADLLRLPTIASLAEWLRGDVTDSASAITGPGQRVNLLHQRRARY
ncbi:non-ribosomal peptide synthetase [Saccharopolyspora sp. NPDC003752]